MVLGKVFIDITEEDARDLLDSKMFVDWRFPVYGKHHCKSCNEKHTYNVGEIDIAIGRNVKDPHYKREE